MGKAEIVQWQCEFLILFFHFFHLMTKTTDLHNYYLVSFYSQFSMRKLGGKNANFVFSGCTTDSGGGGTSFSLYNHMDDLDLCVK